MRGWYLLPLFLALWLIFGQMTLHLFPAMPESARTIVALLLAAAVTLAIGVPALRRKPSAIRPRPESLEDIERRLALLAPVTWRKVEGSQPDPAPVTARPARAAEPLAPLPATSPAPAPARSAAQRGWVGPAETAVVHGRNIGDMVYVGTPPGARQGAGRGWIDPSLPIAPTARDIAGKGMPYWPSYSSIPADCRATYLDWLGRGRADAGYDAGYMFLYFYGLERRFLQDNPPEAEGRAILAEVERLAAVYAASGSARRYLGEFAGLARAMLDGAPERPAPSRTGFEVPFDLLFGLGAQLAAGRPLSHDWLLAWWLNHPDRQVATAMRRCEPEFRLLFGILFYRRYPGGLVVKAPLRPLVAQYRAASGEFSHEFQPLIEGRPVPDVSSMRDPLAVAQSIANEAGAMLDDLSRLLGRDSAQRGSLRAFAVQPPELDAAFPCGAVDALRDWAAARVAGGGLVPLSQLLVRIDGAPAPDRVNRRQMAEVARVLSRAGIGLAPDCEHGSAMPEINDPVLLYLPDEPVDAAAGAVSGAYRDGLVMIGVGTLIAQADGEVSSPEYRSLVDMIDGLEGLHPGEARRLRANLDWLIAVPAVLTQLRGRLKQILPEEHESLRTTLSGIARSDGQLHPEEVTGLARVYRAVGLDPSLVYGDLHAAPDIPITVSPATPRSPGERIPDVPPTPASGLDLARIATIRQDTTRVSAILGQIFSQEDAEPDPPPLGDVAVQASLPGLDPGHSAFVVELVAREQWSEAELEALAVRHRLMRDGALEAVNEWAWDRHGAPLVEEADGFEVNMELAGTLRAPANAEEKDATPEAT